MGIEYNCGYMVKRIDQLGSRTSILFFCEKKKKAVRTCSSCKSKTVEICQAK